MEISESHTSKQNGRSMSLPVLMNDYKKERIPSRRVPRTNERVMITEEYDFRENEDNARPQQLPRQEIISRGRSFDRVEWEENNHYIHNFNTNPQKMKIDVEYAYCCECIPETTSYKVGSMIYDGKPCTCNHDYKTFGENDVLGRREYVLWTPLSSEEFKRRFPPPKRRIKRYNTSEQGSNKTIDIDDVNYTDGEGHNDRLEAGLSGNRKFNGKVYDQKAGTFMYYDIKVDNTGKYHGTQRAQIDIEPKNDSDSGSKETGQDNLNEDIEDLNQNNNTKPTDENITS